MIRLYSVHNEVPTLGSNTKELGIIKSGWEVTITLPITFSKNYDVDYAEAIIYLGDKILDKEILYF